MIDAFIDFFSSDFAKNNIAMLIGISLALVTLSAVITFFITKKRFSSKQQNVKELQETIKELTNNKIILQNKLTELTKEYEMLREMNIKKVTLKDFDDYEKSNH